MAGRARPPQPTHKNAPPSSVKATVTVAFCVPASQRIMETIMFMYKRPTPIGFSDFSGNESRSIKMNMEEAGPISTMRRFLLEENDGTGNANTAIFQAHVMFGKPPRFPM
mmetsp:Transcript_43515/g.138564  ORF Transcript_43515/g.138564 Transcript_43515/m.138564 type:complete len:110 (-) Transcript_43515:1307-1636(-)